MWEVGMCFPGVTAGAHLEGDLQHHPDSWSGQPRASEGPTVATSQLPHCWCLQARGYADLQPALGPMQASQVSPPTPMTHPYDQRWPGVAVAGREGPWMEFTQAGWSARL